MNKIISKEQFSEKVFKLEIEAPLIAKSRRAGHFVIVRVDEKGERMPLTIAGSNLEKGTITLVVQTVGLSSTKLCKLNEGDYVLDVVGPLGQATHIENYGTVVCAGGGVGVAMPGMEKMSDEDAKKLTESIKNMSETAAQLANISRVAGLTDSYANNLQKASEAAAQFATKQQNLDEATNTLLSSYKGIADNMLAAEDKTKSFAEKANELSKNLGSINTSYELQLKGIQSQAAAIEAQSGKINAVTAEFEKLHTAVSASSKNMDAYKQMTDQLAKNVSDLNNVYGNMLNAIKQAYLLDL